MRALVDIGTWVILERKLKVFTILSANVARFRKRIKDSFSNWSPLSDSRKRNSQSLLHELILFLWLRRVYLTLADLYDN